MNKKIILIMIAVTSCQFLHAMELKKLEEGRGGQKKKRRHRKSNSHDRREKLNNKLDTVGTGNLKRNNKPKKIASLQDLKKETEQTFSESEWSGSLSEDDQRKIRSESVDKIKGRATIPPSALVDFLVRYELPDDSKMNIKKYKKRALERLVNIQEKEPEQYDRFAKKAVNRLLKILEQKKKDRQESEKELSEKESLTRKKSAGTNINISLSGLNSKVQSEVHVEKTKFERRKFWVSTVIGTLLSVVGPAVTAWLTKSGCSDGTGASSGNFTV